MLILLVDDEPANLQLLKVLLESRGHRTALASNGQEALLQAQAALPDLVISDILMPVMDGYGLCRVWMQDPRLRTIPFVFYTATYQTEEDEQLGLSMGAAEYLRKPMEPEPFLAQIERVLDRARQGVLHAPGTLPLEERAFLKLYNERLVQKLDKRHGEVIKQMAALKEAEALLRIKGAALEAAADGIAITDSQGVVEWANPSFSQITGIPSERLVGHSLRVLRRESQDPAFFERLWDTLMEGRPWEGEIVNRHEDGSLHTAKTTITPVRNEQGKRTHFIEIMQDITGSKRVEADLRQSQKMEAVGRLAGGVAHDFNNMLNVILMNTELCLATTHLPEESRRRLLDVQHAAERSADLTRQLLAFSRKQPAQPQRILPQDAVGENLKLLRRLIGENIELTFKAEPDTWPIHMDPSQLSQILANLVINARDAIPESGTICIETANIHTDDDSRLFHSGMAPGDYVQLSVSDTGCGMDHTTLERIFEPYFTTKGEGKGTGLGLSIVYGIAQQNGGTVSAYSHLGVGTTLKVYLPRCGAVEAEAAPARRTDLPRGNETILVAEDEPSMLEVLRRALEGQGYTVLASSNPIDVCFLAQQHPGPIHLLLTDVVMPGINGKELRERVTALRPGIQVLFMSGYTGDIMAKRGLLEQEIRFLQKPFRIQDLARMVRTALDAG
jgi:PAS domain S-box-containing protein